MKSEIQEIFELGQALLAQLSSNPVARELAELWDKKHSQEVPTQKALEEIKCNYKKVVWCKRLKDKLMQSVYMLLVFLTGSVLLLCLVKNHVEVGQYMYLACLVLLTLFIPEWIDTRLSAKVDRYRELGKQVLFLYSVDYSVVKSPLDITHEIERLCVLIVQCEAAGLWESDKIDFVNSHGNKVKIELHDLRSMHRNQVSFAAEEFGLVTPDLGIHFKQAKELYSRGLACGHFMGDFQI